MTEDVKVTYDVVSDVAGHLTNTAVVLQNACDDIFSKVKEKSMQLAVGGTFVQFDDLSELKGELSRATTEGLSIRVYDEIVGG